MDDLHLAWMDTQRATKSHVAGKLNGTVQACGVLNRGEHSVQRRGEDSNPSGEQYCVAGVAEDLFGGRAGGGQIQVQAQIEAAERQALNASGFGNRAECRQALGTLDDGPDRLAGAA